jgi:flagellar hook protein FlgE
VSVTFDATNITVGAATAAEVAAVLNGIAGLTASADPAGFVVIVSDRTGAGSSLDVDDVSGAPAGLLGLTTSLVRGTETFAQSSTLLNDLAGNITDYVAGDGIDVSGTGVDGTPFGGTFIIGPGNDTLGDLVTFINSLMPDATAAIDGSGNISITADTESEASLTLSLADGTSNTGATSFSSSGFKVTTEGRGPDEVRTSIDVFDSRGLRHTLTFTFTRIDEIEWDLSVATDNNKDTLIDNQINGIRFDEDGAFSAVTGSGTGGVGIEILFDGLTTSQSIDVSLGTSDQLDGVTQLGLSGSLRALSQDGHASGDLESVSVRSDGVIEGFYSNGQSQDLDQVALAVFANPGGLMRLGNSSYEESPNSGIAQLQIPGSGGAGSVFSGVLESSNVDVAEEFVRLIEAQRGFQANARVIRVSDELLVELVNLV